MGLRLSYSTWGMPDVPIATAVAHCAGLGFDGLELTVCPGWTTEGTALTREQREELVVDVDVASGARTAPAAQRQQFVEAVVADRFHQRHCPADVYEIITARKEAGFGHTHFGCQVKDTVHVFEQLPKQDFFIDIALNKSDLGQQIARVSR